MTVSSLHAIVPAAPAAPAGLPQDAAAPDTGFAQALAQRQSHHQSRTADGHERRPAEHTDTAANGAAGEADTPQDGPLAATTPGVDDKAAKVDAEEPMTDPALAASMQFADFVRELTSASRAVAARSQTATDVEVDDAALPALRAAPGRELRTEAVQGDRMAALAAKPVADDTQAISPAGIGTVARPDTATLPTRPALSGDRADDRAQVRADARNEAAAPQDGAAVTAAALNGSAAARPAPAGAAISSSEHAPAAGATALPTASGAGQFPGSTRLTAAAASATDAANLRADTASTTPTAPAWATAFSAALPQTAPAAGVTPMPAAPAGAGLLEPGVGAPLHSPQWAPALGRQMVLLGSAEGGTIRHAELRLDPPDLGPLRVSLNLSGDQATAVFVSPHPAVRAAVEAALPQLQQALAEAGIQLGNTSVGDQGSWQEARESSQGQGRGRDGEGDDAGQTVAGTEPTITRAAPRGLIDTFA